MSNLDIFVSVEDMMRINKRTNRERGCTGDLSMLPLSSRKIKGKTKYKLEWDVENRSLGEEKPEIIPFTPTGIIVPRIVRDVDWISQALSEIKGLPDFDMPYQDSRIPAEANAFSYGKWWQASADGFYFKTRVKFLRINEGLFDELKTRILDDGARREIAESFMIFDWGEDEIPTAEDRAICMKVAEYDSYLESVRYLFGRQKRYRTAKWHTQQS
ncbi:MAG: hypothetical protein WC584_03975 [Candidatus Pacearchaeota archaeon]